jgi:hypothetical protein
MLARIVTTAAFVPNEAASVECAPVITGKNTPPKFTRPRLGPSPSVNRLTLDCEPPDSKRHAACSYPARVPFDPAPDGRGGRPNSSGPRAAERMSLMSGVTHRLLLLGFLALAPALPCRADEIHELVVKGDIAAVRALLDQHPELISAKGFHDGTPLNFAVLADGNQAKMVSLLLSRGADVNAQDSEGISALDRAAWHGNLEVVKLLVGKHAQVNIRTKDGDTPLYGAVSRGNTDVVKYLLSHQAEVDTYDNDGLTPMNSAIINGDAVIVQMLIANHANVTARLQNGRSLLNLAVDQEWISRTRQPEKNDQYRRIVEMLKKAGAVE